jgi:hypothetical protein
MNYELPCDWSVMKRQHNSFQHIQDLEEEDTPNNSKIKNKERKKTTPKTQTRLCRKRKKHQHDQDKNITKQVASVDVQDEHPKQKSSNSSEDEKYVSNKDVQNVCNLHPLGNKTIMDTKEKSNNFNHIMEDDSDHDEETIPIQNSHTKIQGQISVGYVQTLILKQLQTIIMSHRHCDNDCLSISKQAIDYETNNILTSQKKISNLYVDTDSLVSKLPYKKMLSDIFGGHLKGHLSTSNIPYVTRVYEESFMHEPLNSMERECAKGKLCECMFIDKSQPFTCVEFLLPGEKPQRIPNMCVVCYRAVTQQLYYDVIFDKCEFPGCIQKFGNIHSEVGEYCLDAMLIAAPTAPTHIMPLPIVSHQRNRYSVYVSGGIKRLKQTKVYFQNTPSCKEICGE